MWVSCIWTVFLLLYLGCIVDGSTNMDPRVRISSTVPKADGVIVRGTLSHDVTLDCQIENMAKDKQVWWARSMQDKSGRNQTTPISKNTDVADNNKWSIEKPSPFRWRLRVKAIRVEDEGMYVCYVELNRDVRVEDRVTILVTDPPVIIEAATTTDLMAKEGDEVTLECRVSGRPFPTVMWRREGNAILPEGGVVRLDNKLHIQSIQYRDRGRYICEGLNQVGHVQRQIDINVQFAPKLVPAPAVVKQMRGYMRTLRCIVEANPSPRTDVMASDAQLRFIKGNMGVRSGPGRTVRVLQGAYGKLTLELTIYSIEDEDYGEYECRAANSFGEGSALVTLAESTFVAVDKGGKSSTAPYTAGHCLLSLLLPVLCLLLAA